MLQIDQTIISLDLLEKKFKCDLEKCHGKCCVYGDAGAPLEDSEATVLEKLFPRIKSFLRPEGIQSIEEQGTFVIDTDGEKVTPLIKKQECAYTVIENGIYLCGIEKAFLAKKIKFRKPVSCHLFPVRVKSYSGFSGVNYEQWHICRHAVKLGEETDMPVYKFTKEALKRKFGKTWYKKLKKAADHLKKS